MNDAFKFQISTYKCLQKSLFKLSSVLLICFALLLVSSFYASSFANDKKVRTSTNKPRSLPKLQSMEASLDKTKPTSLNQVTLQGTVRDSRNPAMIAIPRSGSVNAYNAGLKLFKEGAYSRAMTAFKIALARANKFGPKDSRYITALKAIKSTAPHLTPRAQLGYDTDNKNKNSLTGKVTKVFPPDLAWLGGLKKDDRILTANRTPSEVQLKINRNGKLYGLTLKLQRQDSADLKEQIASLAKSNYTPTKLTSSTSLYKGRITHPELLNKEARRLAGYDCILMLDCSGSMGDRIVSLGKRNGKLTTRWNWCKSEMLNLYSTGKAFFPEGLTLVPFANNFAIINEARDSAIKNMFKQLSPVGGTNMAKPLSFLIDDYFRRKARNRGKVKPIVIAILSDGEGNAHLLRQLIIRTTHRMKNPREILITFLAVDATKQGRPVIEAMDSSLHSAGAKYDIVDSRTFDELNRYGLLRMLVAALIEPYAERN